MHRLSDFTIIKLSVLMKGISEKHIKSKLNLRVNQIKQNSKQLISETL